MNRNIFHLKNNEELGILTEYTLCKINNISFNTKRNNIDLDIIYILENIIPKSIILKSHTGNNKQFIHDFIDYDDKTISIKTIMSGNKICPNFIGQCSLKQLILKLNLNIQNKEQFKQYFQQNTSTFISSYVKYMFISDITLIFDFNEKQLLRFEKIKDINLNLLNFTFFKTLFRLE